jgi:hypothetical protein
MSNDWNMDCWSMNNAFNRQNEILKQILTNQNNIITKLDLILFILLIVIVLRFIKIIFNFFRICIS